MIFFFTGTGNSFEAAQVIAETTHDRLADMGAASKAGTFAFAVEQGENLGFVFPVCEWTTPALVDDFVRRLTFVTPNGNPFVPGYCYTVATYGSMTGDAPAYLAELLFKYQQIRVDASFSVKNVTNCAFLTGPGSAESQQRLNREAHVQAKHVAYLIDSKRMVHEEHRGTIGPVLSKITCREGKRHSTRPFHITVGACSHCGLCERICPTNTVELLEEGPKWHGNGCTLCLACLQRCPRKCIQYGGSTAHRARYVNPILHDSPTFAAAIAQTVDARVPDPDDIVRPGSWEEPEVDEGALGAE